MIEAKQLDAVETWQQSLKTAVTCPQKLLQILNIEPQHPQLSYLLEHKFPLLVPNSFIQRMQTGNINDPLLMQVLPLSAELTPQPGFTADPLQEKAANPLPGLIHKYKSRVLLTISGKCGINCRYCFRREFDYGDNNPGRAGWGRVIEYISQDSSINEVIYSGGDPLTAPDSLLEEITQKISQIPHIKTLRIHTRMPIVIPNRITTELINWLSKTRLNPVMVLHCNHSQELNSTIQEKIQILRQNNVTVLNQTVLLRGINDNADTLVSLSEKLFDYGGLPYYLHLLDKVHGTAHFDVPITRAKDILKQMQAELPGYLVPRLVQELPNEKSKQLII